MLKTLLLVPKFACSLLGVGINPKPYLWVLFDRWYFTAETKHTCSHGESRVDEGAHRVVEVPVLEALGRVDPRPPGVFSYMRTTTRVSVTPRTRQTPH